MIQPSSSSLTATDTPVPPVAAAALEQALEQSHEVKAKVEACAEDLAQANEGAKRTIAAGATTLPARQTLDHNLRLRSYRSAQIWTPEAVSINWVVTRSRLPARRTLPSSA